MTVTYLSIYLFIYSILVPHLTNGQNTQIRLGPECIAMNLRQLAVTAFRTKIVDINTEVISQEC